MTAYPITLKVGTRIAVKVRGVTEVRTIKRPCPFYLERQASRGKIGKLELADGRRIGIAVLPAESKLQCLECGRKTNCSRCPNCGGFDVEPV